MSGGLVVRCSDGRVGIASCGPVFLNIIRSPVDMALVREMERHVADHAATCGGVYSTLSVIEPAAAKRQDKEAQAAAANLGREFRVERVAVVIGGDGFVNVALRAALSAMYLFKPPKYPYKIFGSPSDGARWLEAQGAGATEREILDAIAAIRVTR